MGLILLQAITGIWLVFSLFIKGEIHDQKINRKLALLVFILSWLIQAWGILPSLLEDFSWLLSNINTSLIISALVCCGVDWVQKNRKNGTLRQSIWKPVLIFFGTAIFLHLIILFIIIP